MAGDGVGRKLSAGAEGAARGRGKFGFNWTSPRHRSAGQALTPPVGVARRYPRAVSRSDSILFGSVGLPDRYDNPEEERPSARPCSLRKEFDLFANLPGEAADELAHRVEKPKAGQWSICW